MEKNAKLERGKTDFSFLELFLEETTKKTHFFTKYITNKTNFLSLGLNFGLARFYLSHLDPRRFIRENESLYLKLVNSAKKRK